MISIITPTYNRAKTLPRAIGSILKQDYLDWELIIVDDGSSDDTQEYLATLQEPRIQVIVHPQNRGVAAALNSGFAAMHGDWFTTVDSDDELVVPHALSTAMQVLEDVDPKINAITYNCVDFSTGQWSGRGLNQSQFLPEPVARCSGEFRGITRTTLLGSLRFNEKIIGTPSVFWSKIDQKAPRYYLHKALYIYHTEGQDRLIVSKSKIAAGKNHKIYESYIALLEEEPDYLDYLKKVSPEKYIDLICAGACVFINANDRKRARSLISELVSFYAYRQALIISVGIISGPEVMNSLRAAKRSIQAQPR